MQIKTYQKTIRISPRKLKTMITTIKGMDLAAIQNTLPFTAKRSARILAKVLKQAAANAKIKEPDLKRWSLVSIQALKGPTSKRFKAVSRGRAHSIMKRTSHLRIVMETHE